MRNKTWLAILFSTALVLAACAEKSESGAPGFTIPPGQTGAISTAQEACVACHGEGTALDVKVAVNDPATLPTVVPVHTTPKPATATVDTAITSVDFNATTGVITVTAVVQNTAAPTVAPTIGTNDVRFTVVVLVTSANGGPNQNWFPYFINTDATSSTDQATYDRPGDWYAAGMTATPDSPSTGFTTVVYTLSRDPNQRSVPTSKPGAAFNYNPWIGPGGAFINLPHRIGMQVTSGISNGWMDFTPTGVSATFTNDRAGTLSGATAVGPGNTIQTASGTPSREIVKTASCNECHGALALHGGTRRDVEYCVSCHNPSSTDPDNAPNLVDFKVIIHKLHMGKELPSVAAGDTYKVANNDYSKGGFPQTIENCNKCHTGSQGTNWYAMPSREACGTCHDRTYFTATAPTSGTGWVQHGGGQQNADGPSGCGGCHHADKTASTGIAVQNAHPWAQQVASRANYAYSITSATYSSTTKQVTVAFTITSPNGGDLTAGEWRKASGASRLGLDLGWKNAGAADYTSEGAATTTTSAPGSPKSYDLLCPLTTGGATCGTGGALGAPSGYTVTGGPSTYTAVIDMPTAGQSARTGIVILEGHPAETIPTTVSGTTSIRIPVYTVFKEFKVSGSSSQSSEPRRAKVVDATKCQNCHGDGAGAMLSLHGENRNINPTATGGILICTVCHNSANSDKAQRPTNLALTDDGKKEEAIDFKRMIHRIHAGVDTTAGYIEIFGFGNSKHKFAGEFPPGAPAGSTGTANRLMNCENCHDTSGTPTYTLPLVSGMQGTTVDSGTSLSDHTDDLNMSPNTAICSGCHDSTGALNHMQLMGGALSVKEADIEFY